MVEACKMSPRDRATAYNHRRLAKANRIDKFLTDRIWSRRRLEFVVFNIYSEVQHYLVADESALFAELASLDLPPCSFGLRGRARSQSTSNSICAHRLAHPGRILPRNSPGNHSDAQRIFVDRHRGRVGTF